MKMSGDSEQQTISRPKRNRVPNPTIFNSNNLTGPKVNKKQDGSSVSKKRKGDHCYCLPEGSIKSVPNAMSDPNGTIGPLRPNENLTPNNDLPHGTISPLRLNENLTSNNQLPGGENLTPNNVLQNLDSGSQHSNIDPGLEINPPDGDTENSFSNMDAQSSIRNPIKIECVKTVSSDNKNIFLEPETFFALVNSRINNGNLLKGTTIFPVNPKTSVQFQNESRSLKKGDFQGAVKYKVNVALVKIKKTSLSKKNEEKEKKSCQPASSSKGDNSTSFPDSSSQNVNDEKETPNSANCTDTADDGSTGDDGVQKVARCSGPSGCGTLLSSYSQFVSHVQSVHEIKDAKTTVCERTGHPTLVKTAEDIMSTEIPRRNYCRECKEFFMVFSVFANHMKTVHGSKEVKPYECVKCFQTFIRPIELRSHYQCHKTKKPFFCDICGKRFVLEKALKSHLIIHAAIRPFPCTFEGCDKIFVQKPPFLKHLRLKHGIIEGESQ